MKSIPTEQMRTYSTVPAKASPGACISSDIWGARASIPTVTRTLRAAKKKMPAPTARPPSSPRPSPMRWPSSTVTPMARPQITMVMVCRIWLPVETALMSAAVPKFPTTCRSTAPYIACRKSASSTGRANLVSAGRMAPWVKSSFRSMLSHSLSPPPSRRRSFSSFRRSPALEKAG